MKIAIIALGIYPIQVGGGEILISRQVQRLRKRGHQVSCFTKREPNDNPVSSIELQSVHRLGSPAPGIGQLTYLLALTWKLFRMRREIDVVHVQYAGYPLIAAFLWQLLTGKPYIVGFMGSDLLVWGRRPVWRQTLRVLLGRASFAIIWSPQTKEILVEEFHVPSNRVMVLRIDMADEDLQEIKKRFPSPSSERGAKTVLFLGNLKPVKDPMTAVRAFEIVSRSLPEARFVIIGDGPYRSEILDYIGAHGIASRVEVKGSLPHEDALKALHDSDVLLITSISEAGPMAAKEAMAMRVPVVGSKIDALKAFIEDGRNGLLVTPRAPEEFAEAILKVLKDDSLSSHLAEEAYRDINTSPWRNWVSEYERLYRLASPNRRYC